MYRFYGDYLMGLMTLEKNLITYATKTAMRAKQMPIGGKIGVGLVCAGSIFGATILIKNLVSKNEYDNTSIENISTLNPLDNNSNNSIVDNEQNIDGEIGFSKQGNVYDCKLLAQLNGLSYTDWGRNVIKNAIKPDGNGGAIVTFAGAKSKQKVFKVSAEELADSEKLKAYTQGDDDVRAIEIACNKYLETMGSRLEDGESVESLSDAALVGLFFKDKINVKLHNLLLALYDFRKYETTVNAIDKILLHPGKYVAETGFLESFEFNGEYYGAHHAYTIKRIDFKDGKKYVVLTEPSDSSKEYYLEGQAFKVKSNITALYSLVDNSDFDNPLLRKSTYNEQKQFVDNLTEGQRFLYMSEFPDKVICGIDTRQLGWNKENEKRKECLMKPFIESVANEAKRCNIDTAEIEKFKETCYKALNAKFFTRAYEITGTVKQMVKLIEEHYKNSSDELGE